MYNAHRGMGQPPASNSNNRLSDLFDQIRREFDVHAQDRAGEHDQSMAAQMQEMEMVRQKVYELERNQIAIKQRYDEDIARLRHEIEARGGPPSHVGVSGLPPHGGVSQPAPPAIGHGPSNLFGGIMANPPGQGNPGLVPPSQDQQQQQQQGPPPHQMPQPQQGLQSGPYQGNYPQPPVVNGYGSQGQIASPGPGKPRNNRGPLGHTSTPQQSQPMSYPGASPQMGRPSPPPPFHNVGNMLADLDPDQVRPDQKREGQDWFAIFNSNVRRVLDVDLVHTISHESVVCCVRFSRDGRYVATGCNRSAQIFEVSTGNQVTKLQDDSVDKDGDLYIRSVCFSPDGLYLATGAEDKQIRVWDIQSRTIKTTFAGHEQDIYSLDFASNGRSIASGSGDHSVRVWDLEYNREVQTFTIEDGVTTVAISPSGDYVAAGSLDKSVRVWEVRGGHLIARLDGADGHKDSVYSVAFGPDGETLVSGSLDKTIKMWQLSPDNRGGMMGGGISRVGRLVRTFEGHKDFVLSVALTPDGEWVLSGSKDRGVQFWNPRTGETQLMLQGHKNSVISVAPSPQGELFATGSGDMRARIWKYGNYRGT